MPTVKFTSALKRFYPELDELEVEAKNVNELLENLEEKFSGIKNYILDDQGTLRNHVNIFIDGALLPDRNNLTDAISSKSEVYIMQALSGG